jgi:uncharacterized membrane protein
VVSAYGVLKFLHVLSVIVWVGGVTGLAVVTWRLRRERNREILAVLLRHATSYGQTIAGPASVVVLLSGVAMVGMAGIGFGTFWVVWGFAGIVLHILIGAVFIRKRTLELARLASTNGGDDQSLLEAARKLWMVQLIYVAIMASVVWAMVLKPTL